MTFPMRARPSFRPPSIKFLLTLAAVLALGTAGSARASDADPFADDGTTPAVPSSNVSKPSKQAPASAPAGSETNFPTGLVERLPSSAYPEPVVRGLYGSSLWLDMQGLQWPYYPRIGVGVSGYSWVDTDFKRTRIGDPGQSPHTTKLFMQGRFDLRVTPTYSNGTWFVQAQAEIIGSLETLDLPRQPVVADTDDLWVRTGTWNVWDLTVGRFEGFSVYHLGMGLDLNTDERIGAYDGSHGSGTVPQPYLASYMYYRPQGPANIALHFYPAGLFDGPSFLSALLSPIRLELLAQWGNDGTSNIVGGRPAIIYDLGWLKARFAAEYQWKFPQDPAPEQHNEYKNRGIAGSLQFVLAPWVELGPNIGSATTDFYSPSTRQPDGTYQPDTGKSGDTLSYGGFLNLAPFTDFLIGLGANYASSSNLHLNTGTGQYDKSSNTQAFLALQYLVHHQLFVKVVGGYAKTHFDFSFTNMGAYDDDMYSIRVRLMYLY
jgi:hypothetical protein